MSWHNVRHNPVVLMLHLRSYVHRLIDLEISISSKDIHRFEHVLLDIRHRMMQLTKFFHLNVWIFKKKKFLLGGWWDVCSAINVTFSSFAHGTGPSLAKLVYKYIKAIMFFSCMMNYRTNICCCCSEIVITLECFTQNRIVGFFGYCTFSTGMKCW